MSIDANEVGKARSKIVEIAKAILAGDISYIEGVRVILTRWPEARADHLEEWMVFLGIDSETDHFPMGRVREMWDVQALQAMQPKLDKAEKWARTYGEGACIKVIELFEKNPVGDL